MRNLHIDCSMGVAGDMISAALLELLPEEEQMRMIEKLNNTGLNGVCVRRDRILKCGIIGSHLTVLINGESESVPETNAPEEDEELCEHRHHAMHMSDIEKIIDALDLSKKVQEDAKAVYRLLAEAESHAHGTEVSEIHFHEVGMRDAIMDIVSACVLMDVISPDKVTASAVHTGCGQVKCAHGILPVPAPATAYLLTGVPVYSTGIEGELCTPTGAALLKYFVDDFGPMPVMTPERIGYGMGTRDYPAANCLRVMLGEIYSENTDEDTVTGLSCNLDDMTGEEIGFAVERLYEAGAKEVYTVPVGMKKSRPGIKLEVLCDIRDRDSMIHEIFKHTSTIGIRETGYRRYILNRTEEERDTGIGKVRIKRSEGFGVTREKYEYEDLARLARQKGMSLEELREKL